MKVITSVRSIHTAHLQTALLLNKPYAILENSTLNEKYGINADAVLLDGERPVVQYYSIGRGGHQSISGSDGSSNVGGVPQFSSHSALYKHLPFVLKPINDDLGEAERANYGLRRKETHNTVDYYAYYLKRLNVADSELKIEYNKKTSGGDTISTPYTPRPEDLSPTPIEIGVGAISAAGDSLSVLATIPLVFSAQDVTNLKEACAIIYGSEDYALVSEIAICSGVDRELLTEGPSGEFSMNEAVAVQVQSMLTTHQAVTVLTNGFEMDIDVGSAEALSI